jgi:hypothetical protein
MSRQRPLHGSARDVNEKEIIKALENLGALVLRLDPPQPDLLVGYLGSWHLIEIKSAKGILTKGQLKLLSACETRELPFTVVRSGPDAIRAICGV